MSLFLPFRCVACCVLRVARRVVALLRGCVVAFRVSQFLSDMGYEIRDTRYEMISERVYGGKIK